MFRERTATTLRHRCSRRARGPEITLEKYAYAGNISDHLRVDMRISGDGVKLQSLSAIADDLLAFEHFHGAGGLSGLRIAPPVEFVLRVGMARIQNLPERGLMTFLNEHRGSKRGDAANTAGVIVMMMRDGGVLDWLARKLLIEEPHEDLGLSLRVRSFHNRQPAWEFHDHSVMRVGCGMPDAIAVGRAPRGHGPGIWAPQQSMERPGTTFEHDDGAVTVEGVTHLRLWPQLDKGGWPCRATLMQEERR